MKSIDVHERVEEACMERLDQCVSKDDRETDEYRFDQASEDGVHDFDRYSDADG